ncbi:zonadhesin [Balaenoptera ricei]|uniref:zonadhesin n=1 Tax=Balaenoptera ricei TaxID=2746895 RepID=UPI0028BF3DDE|nr:zonadhesin [Balaenoptera ricei]
MAPPVWTLLLLLGAAWGQGHMPAPARKEKPLDWKPVSRSSRENSILTQCDFEDDSRPLCDWSQVSKDDGGWTRASEPSPTSSTGPPSGYPNGEGYFLHMDSNTFRPGGVARLRSPPVWEQGPLCVRFAYYMFGLSWGAQLKLLLTTGPKGKRPNVLWKHMNTQSPSWIPTAVTVPMGLILPSRLTFEGVRGSTAYLDIALDAISIRRGSCNRVCMMQTCSFDTPNDLCGWSWIPTASGAKWVQKKGSTGVLNVGPEDDFSSPGSGFYMLLDPKNAKPRQRSALLSPLIQSSGCLSLSFHYTLHGQSPGAALMVYASVLGRIRKHTLFSGQPGPNWQPVSVNYTGQGQIQFTVVGVFGKIPEPVVAVDAISIAPCRESFPQCDFEDEAHPFCDWVQTLQDGGHWTQGSKNTLIQGTGPLGVSLNGEGHFAYIEADKFSQAGQSFRLASRTFCAPGAICVEFTYYMYGLGNGTKLRLLLGRPADSSPTSLWERVGSQSADWLNDSITVPSGHQQPMQLMFEAERGTSTAFVVALGFILISHGTCQGSASVAPPSKPPVTRTGPPETPVRTEKPVAPEETPTIPTEISTVPAEKPVARTEKPTVPSEISTVPTERTTIPTEKPTVPTEKTTIPTEKPTVPTERTTIPTEKPTVPTERTTIPTERTTIPTEKPTVPTERPTVPTTPQPSPTLVPTWPAAFVMPSTSMTAVTQATTATPRPTPVSCPPNAHYEHCACPASCQSPTPNCGLLCKPGCVCDPGFLFSDSRCINASSCNCFYNDNYYKPGTAWFSPSCTERCRCQPGSRTECQPYQCRTRTACQLKNGQYGCQPYGTATCFIYGDPHYFTFDGRHFNFMGKCTYILAQPCGNSTEPFFRLTVKNKERGQEGVSCLSKIYVTLPETTITLLKGRHTLVGGQRVTLPAIPSKGIFLTPSGRFVQLQTAFGLRVRWDGDQQLSVSVPSTYSSKLCGFCGNYDGDSSNDNRKPDGRPARDEMELGSSWQASEDGDQECQEKQASPPPCDTALQNTVSGPEFCGRLTVAHGAFEACLPHLRASSFFDNCMFDMCNFQGLQQMLCAHMSALTETCQDAGYVVKPWRGPQFCPLACPPNSRYTLCAKLCPDTCHSEFSGLACQNRCVEGCECDPGFVLSGLQCVPRSECGCLDPTAGYFKVGERWFKPGCRQLCICEGSNRTRCVQWRCQAQEVCGRQDGIYGCHAQGSATCTVSGDPHYLTFDGALHHFMGTCTYTLTQPCWLGSPENYFVVSATNEFRGGNLEASYVKAVQVQVFNLRISMIKGRKVVLDGRRVALPVWPAQGRVNVRSSGSFILLYTDFGLQVRYDGNHLVEVTVPSSYAGRLCGMCGNFNNNSLDDNLQPDKRPAVSSVHLGASWKLNELSEPGCFAAGGKPPRCLGKKVTDAWNKNCDILMNPQGPFSQCHGVVAPHTSFTSCVYGQCGTEGDALTLCRSLQAYASLCARAGRAVAWRNTTSCPLNCPLGSSYSTCANPCPTTCLSLSTPSYCPSSLPCAEGCECQKGHILSGTSCVPLSQCGCTSQRGSYHPVGESWYTDSTCSRLCTCSAHNNISCLQTACKPGQMCWSQDGLIRCRVAGMGECRIRDTSYYVSFDGSYHAVRGTCTYVLVKICHSTMDQPFFKISGKNGKRKDQPHTFYLRQVHVDIFNTLVTLKKDQVLINGTQVTLPATTQIRGVKVISRDGYTVLTVNIGVQVKFDGSGFLEVEIPKAYYEKTCGMCGNFNGEEEDELLMPNDELALDDVMYVDSWQDKEIDPNCQEDDKKTEAEPQEKPNTNCRAADLARAQEQCQAAFQAPAWAKCATHVILSPFLLRCTHSLCEFGDLNHALCQSLQAFGAACQAQGIKPPIWRNSSFCPLDCSAYSVYTTCVPSCPPSCWDPEGQCKGSRVPSTCEQGCVCEPGYVLSGPQCVPRSQCSCRDAQGNSLPAGKSWFSRGCSKRCACRAGAVQCWPFTCPLGSRCQPNEDGKDYCAPEKSEQCTIYGDPRYHTFDGLSYRFQGRMTYFLIKTLDMLPDGVEPLVVEGRNKVYPSFNPIFLHEIIVMVYGYTVQLQTELGLVVNGQKMAIPYEPNDQLRVTMRGHRLYLITDFELVISFNGKNNAAISLPITYRRLVRGLCGNYDQNKRNDFMLPNGALTQNLLVFGNSWEVKKTKGGLPRFSREVQEEEVKEEEASGFHVSECSPEQLELIGHTQACRVLVDPHGPFAACHQPVAPEPFLEHCVSDLCAARDPIEQEELRCQVLSGYAIICQEAGVAPVGWRDHTRCALPCPANTVYQSCMTPCPDSCATLAAPRDCKGPCVEGCASLPGYIYSGAQSLPLAHCGCTNNGIYYQQGDGFVTEDCSQRCTCASSGVLLCEPLSCSPGEICTLGNLTRGCFRDSPCLQNPCQNDGRCQEQGTHFTCECELGYGGHLCTEPRDVPPTKTPEASNFVVTLLGWLVPVLVTVSAVTRECISRKRRREKMQSQTRGKLPDLAPEHAFKVAQF